MKKFLLLWLLGALLIAVLLSQFNLPRLYPLAERGIQACGTVTSFEPHNHQRVNYTFSANGRTYTGSHSGSGDQSNSACAQPGSYVVYYLPEDPYISSLRDPRSELENEVITIVLGMLIFPLFILLVFRWQKPKFRRWLAS